MDGQETKVVSSQVDAIYGDVCRNRYDRSTLRHARNGIEGRMEGVVIDKVKYGSITNRHEPTSSRLSAASNPGLAGGEDEREKSHG